MSLLPDETGNSTPLTSPANIDSDVMPLRKFATAGKMFSPSQDNSIVSFFRLTNDDGTPRMFRKVFDENNKLIGYREMKS